LYPFLLLFWNQQSIEESLAVRNLFICPDIPRTCSGSVLLKRGIACALNVQQLVQSLSCSPFACPFCMTLEREVITWYTDAMPYILRSGLLTNVRICNK
jgi:hypothetical protein